MTYKIQLPVGDWSGDGHGQCVWYTIQSSVDVEALRELYFKTCKIVGVGLDSRNAGPCCQYEDGEVSNNWFLKVGVSADKISDLDEGDDDGFYASPDSIADMFVEFMVVNNPALELAIIPDEVPMFPFHGLDKLGRHIGFMGYGVTGS